MLGPGEDAQVAQLLTAQGPPRDHALHGLFQYALRETTLEHLARGYPLDAAGVTGVLVIDLVRQLLAGELDLVRVDDDDIVTAIDVRGERRLVLAAQNVRDHHRGTADDQIGRVDDMPLLLHLVRLRRLGGLHQRLHGG